LEKKLNIGGNNMFNNIFTILLIAVIGYEIKMIVDGIKEVYHEVINWTE
jgi:hypothetical protein